MCKLVAEAAELKSDETKLTISQARRHLNKQSKSKDPACRVSFEFRFFYHRNEECKDHDIV